MEKKFYICLSQCKAREASLLHNRFIATDTPVAVPNPTLGARDGGFVRYFTIDPKTWADCQGSRSRNGLYWVRQYNAA